MDDQLLEVVTKAIKTREEEFIINICIKFRRKGNMSLWGNKDTVYSTGNVTTIAITNGDGLTVTGSGTTWNEGNGVVPGSTHHGSKR